MANGEAMRGLCDIVNAAGATLVGIGCAVEKGFQGGGDRLRAAGMNLKSLAIIESAEPGNIVFRDETILCFRDNEHGGPRFSLFVLDFGGQYNQLIARRSAEFCAVP